MPDINTDPVPPPQETPSPQTVEQVRALLAAAGLNPPDPQVEIVAAGYPVLRATADRLDALVYDDDPAPVFDPVPMFRASRDV